MEVWTSQKGVVALTIVLLTTGVSGKTYLLKYTWAGIREWYLMYFNASEVLSTSTSTGLRPPSSGWLFCHYSVVASVWTEIDSQYLVCHPPMLSANPLTPSLDSTRHLSLGSSLNVTCPSCSAMKNTQEHHMCSIQEHHSMCSIQEHHIICSIQDHHIMCSIQEHPYMC